MTEEGEIKPETSVMQFACSYLGPQSRISSVVWSLSSWETHSRWNSPKDLQLTESQFSPATARNTP